MKIVSQLIVGINYRLQQRRSKPSSRRRHSPDAILKHTARLRAQPRNHEGLDNLLDCPLSKNIQSPEKVKFNLCDLSFKRIPGVRIKHRVKQNWLKMVDKAGSILRLEMVINEPEGFTVRKQVMRKGKKVMRWVDMRKGVAYLCRSTSRWQPTAAT